MVQQPRVAPGTLEATAWQWTGVGLAMLATTAVFVAMAVYVWRRRGGSAGIALALVLVALLLWAGTYAAELGAADLGTISRWGDVKFIGLVLLPPAWFAFAALSPGAGRGSTGGTWPCWPSTRSWSWSCWPTPPPTTSSATTRPRRPSTRTPWPSPARSSGRTWSTPAW
jgi:hypothetical protein